MQKLLGRTWSQARQQAQEEEEKQNNIYSMISQEEMAWGDAALSTAIPVPAGRTTYSLAGHARAAGSLPWSYMDGQLHWARWLSLSQIGPMWQECPPQPCSTATSGFSTVTSTYIITVPALMLVTRCHHR